MLKQHEILDNGQSATVVRLAKDVVKALSGENSQVGCHQQQQGRACWGVPCRHTEPGTQRHCYSGLVLTHLGTPHERGQS